MEVWQIRQAIFGDENYIKCLERSFERLSNLLEPRGRCSWTLFDPSLSVAFRTKDGLMISIRVTS